LSGARTSKAAWALIAVACLSAAGCGEPNWSKVDPSFTPETAPREVRWSFDSTTNLHSIWRNGQELWAVGDKGTILHTNDGGRKWEPVTSTTNKDLFSVAGGGQELWAVGDGGTILHTNDGGRKWEPVTSTTNKDLYSVTGGGQELWTVGDGGTILHTNDGGRKWEPQASPTNKGLSSVTRSGQALWAVGQDGTILHTNDGGRKWEPQTGAPDTDLSSVTGSGPELWVVGEEGTILHTNDGGRKWEPQTSPSGVDLSSVTGSGPELWAVGMRGTVLHTNDGGRKWQQSQTPTRKDLHYISGSGPELWAVGDGGTILQTNDSGTNWKPLTPADKDLHSVTGSTSEFWAVGEGGTILQTTDGGGSWEPQTSPTNRLLYSVAGRGPRLWAVGDGGTILHTTDGGMKWESQTSPTNEPLKSVTGSGQELWAVGDGATIVHTSDGGGNWGSQKWEPIRPIEQSLISIAGSGPELWAVGARGTILHTNDGGSKWQPQNSPTDKPLYSVTGSNQELWAVGPVRTILHTKDGGGKWEEQTSPTDKSLYSVTGSGPELWGVGEAGTILHTADGGKNWNPEARITTRSLYSAIYIAPNLVAVGKGGATVHGIAVSRYPYVKDVRFRKGISSARLEFRVSYPAEAGAWTTRASLKGLNASMFEEGQAMRTGFTNDLSGPETGSDVWAFDFSPNRIFVGPGARAQFRIELTSDRFTTAYDATLSYDPWAWFRDHAAPLSAAGLAFLILVTLTACLFTKPLWNLSLYRAARIYNITEQISLPGVGPVVRELLRVTLLPWFVQHRRTLDAWVRAHIAVLPEGWQLDIQDLSSQGPGTDNVQTRPSYVPLPVRLRSTVTGNLKQAPTAEWASSLFNGRRTIIEIAGPGGAGKTTLARQFAQWALDGGRPEGLKLHAMLPVWVDEELDEKNTLLDVIRRKLTAWFPEEEIETELIQALLKKQRILVIVDRLSERSAATQQYVSNIHGGLKVNALIVTTRQEVKFEAGAPLILYPQALDSKSLLHFMTSILAEYAQQSPSGAPHAFDTIERQLDLGHRLAALIQVRGARDDEMPILPLTVRVFVDEAVRLILAERPLDELPRSLPEAYFRSLEKLNPKTPGARNVMTDEAMLSAAKLLGKLATGGDFIPKEFSMPSARESLRSGGWTDPEKLDPVQRLIDNGVLVEKKRGGFHALRFELDPIAEFLSAAAWAEQCGARIADWQDLKKRSASAPGFQIALRLTLADMNVGIEWDKI
jgi:photosystem II stability/assembly factor-like uncharacterized protein